MTELNEEKPDCGLYRTTVATIDGIQAGRLVYFHNHGEPGPGIYYPERWVDNRAVFATKGHMIPSEEYADSLVPLHAEGFYRVESEFYCCEKHCRNFAPGDLVQLGYDGEATPILFTPGYRGDRFELPETGTPIHGDGLDNLEPLQIPSLGSDGG